MANVYVSGVVAITAEVLTDRQMQRGILIEYRERPLSFIVTLLLPLNKVHKWYLQFKCKT